MPYFYRRYYPRRRRRLWRRRTRKPFRPRYFWRRRHRRVRKKLKKIHIQQWQPTRIRKLKVFGMYPLYEGTNLRIANDNTQYIDTVAPYNVPGGGLFSITVFTLKGLYELHLKARNWWTASNCNMPLIKYLGCKIYLYRSSESDYVTVYARCGSLTATEQLFQSCQPSILTLNKHHKIVTCKKDNKNKRPYKVLKIPPPSLMLNKWYFQKEIVDTPLVMIITSAMSTDRWFSSANSISSTIGFKTLNTKIFQYHPFKMKGTTPYKPNDEYYLFTIQTHTTDWESAQVKNLILLGDTMDMRLGETINDSITTYFETRAKWGNPFFPQTFLNDSNPILLIQASNITELKSQITHNINNTIKNAKQSSTNPLRITDLTQPTTIDCRYNPQPDMGHNAVFLANIFNDNSKWHEPPDESLETKGLPLWLLLFGWTDWLLKSQKPQRPFTDYVAVIISSYISPQLDYYVPLDMNFINGRSPFEQTDHVKDYDKQNWHPKLNFQEETIAKIVNTGPATIKLPDRITAEAKMRYMFYFKLGGCPPPMDDVCDPKKQPMYPTPGNFLSSTLLQNPEFPPEYYLYNFDQRRETITKKAAKRLKTDTGFTETFFKPTGQTSMSIQTRQAETSSEESETEEESEKTLEQQLERHHRKQRKLKRRILKLMTQIMD
nr:MAG: ORF1 [TTV-like mini virus]